VGTRKIKEINMLAVLLYEKVTNKPAGIPDVWPAEVKEVTELPNSDWIEMSVAEFEAYKATHQATYNTWYQSTIPAADPNAVFVDIVNKAKVFAESVIITAAAENIRLGITQAGKTKLVADTLKDLVYYLQSGSLYEAMAAIDAVVVTPEMSPFITAERLLIFKNKIRAYLGLPPL
jgi:hypothetical protein